MTNPDALRGDLLRAADAFAAHALGSLGPVGARAAQFAQHVVVRCHPPRARLLLEGPDGDIRVVHTTDRIPAALGSAVAAVLAGALAHLEPVTRSRVAQLQAAGYSLGVAVEQMTATARVMIDAGADEPVILATLKDAEPETWH